MTVYQPNEKPFLGQVVQEKQVSVGDFVVPSLAFSPEGNTLVSGGSDGTVRAWNAVTNSDLQSVLRLDCWLHQVAFSPDSRYVALLERCLRDSIQMP